MVKKIGEFFKKGNNDWIKITVSVFISAVMVIFFSKTVANSYAIPSISDTLIAGQGNVTADRINLFPELTADDEVIALIPFYATDEATGTRYVVYCLEKDKGWIVGETITKSDEPLDNGYLYIIQNGYPNGSNSTGNTSYDEYLTRVAIWLYQDRSSGVLDTEDGVLTANQKSVITSSRYYSYIEPLVTGALNAKDNDSFLPSFDIIDENSVSINNDNCDPNYFEFDSTRRVFKSRLYSVSSNIDFDSYQISVTNSFFKVYLEDGTLVNSTDTISSTSKFYIEISESDLNNLDITSISFNVIVNYTNYEVYRYAPSNEGMQESVVALPVAVPKSQSLSGSLDIPFRNLAINKTDIDGNNLSSAHLAVYNYYTGEEVANFTTTDEKYIVENLLPGTYIIDELSAPSGYYSLASDELKDLKKPNGDSYVNPVARVELGDLSKLESILKQVSGCITNVDNVDLADLMEEEHLVSGSSGGTDIVNYLYEVKIRKVDSDSGDVVPLAVLNIINSDNEIVDTVTTGDDYVSVDTSKMTEGTYKIVEVSAPDGYILNNEEQEFTLDRDHTSISVDFEDKKNEVIIEKKDEDNNFISGAVLRLIKVSDNSIVDEWTSDDKGHSVSRLDKGDYKIIEVSAPDGYTLNSSEVTFEITGEETETKTVTFYNSNNQVVINKVDENGNPLSGARLRVVNSNGDVIETFTTSNDPYLIEKLSPGTYYVEEIEAPSGYALNRERESFVVDQNTTTIQVTMENDKTIMYLGKVDQTNEYIAGSTLRLLDSNKEEVRTFVSSNVPTEIEGLEYGTYYLEEVEAPLGYIRSDELVEINFNENISSGVFTIANYKGSLTITKVDSDTGSIISGVSLELRKGDDVIKTITTTNSPTVIDDLSEGTYKVVEVSTPLGYVKSDKEYEVTIDSNNPNGTVTIENKPITVNLGKIDAKSGQYISGATMRLSRLDGNMDPITFVSTDSPYTVKRLSPGLYTLEELEAPLGYVGVGSIVTFEVLETGKVQTINISNDITTISVNNRILSVDTKGVSGYKFRLETRDGTVIDEFTTGADVYNSDPLDLGDYTLKQIEAPEGVIVNDEPIYFSVGDSSEVSVINFVNDFTKINISKQDMTNSEEVSGAHLIIRDSNGNIVEEWTSTNTPHYIEKLPVGRYTLTETIAPDGYILNTSIVDFEVLESGDIQSTTMFNAKPIEVPNTGSSATYIYLLGGILIIIGGVLMYISYANKIKNLSR